MGRIGRPKIWQPIPDRPGYEAHPDGRVRRITEDGSSYRVPPYDPGTGHKWIQFGSDLELQREVIARTFLNEPPVRRDGTGIWVFHEIEHVDGNTANCSAKNLRYVRDEEMKHLAYARLMSTAPVPSSGHLFRRLG